MPQKEQTAEDMEKIVENIEESIDLMNNRLSLYKKKLLKHYRETGEWEFIQNRNGKETLVDSGSYTEMHRLLCGYMSDNFSKGWLNWTNFIEQHDTVFLEHVDGDFVYGTLRVKKARTK